MHSTAWIICNAGPRRSLVPSANLMLLHLSSFIINKQNLVVKSPTASFCVKADILTAAGAAVPGKEPAYVLMTGMELRLSIADALIHKWKSRLGPRSSEILIDYFLVL